MLENYNLVSDRPAREKVLLSAKRLLPEPGSRKKLRQLPISVQTSSVNGWQWIEMPAWSYDLAPSGNRCFYVPRFGNKQSWKNYDWWRGAEYLLTSQFEKDHEQRYGPIHSYASRLPHEFMPVLDHAWVNRIILFLRRWWSVEENTPEEQAFGPIPKPLLYLTHDVDAVSKTLMTRSKQAAFCLYNRQYGNAKKFFFSPADYWQFDNILALEDRFGRTSHWNIYGGRGGWWRSPKEILMDPAYNVLQDRIVQQIRSMSKSGHFFGLHPRFETWKDETKMRHEKEKIEQALGEEISEVRQHWLRFSFKDTWKCQSSAGLKHDMTLGFNDRAGFRNGTALSYIDTESSMLITPMIMMDSHLYDYSSLNDEERFKQIDQILDELALTGGEASIIWHQRVFHSDFGWGKTYEYLLSQMRTRGFSSG